ncbi:MAG: class I SAM-dependent methyltransferase [Hyphomonadaceae bacterium]|nr:class I SAM-dependent methyltransferase [Hyphomonadaceae bacterium]
MTADDRTLAFYNTQARHYAERGHGAGMLHDFVAELAPGARVLDLGCGGCWHSAKLRDAGFAVTAIDASDGLAAEAKRRWDIDVRVMQFSELDFVDAFDGVWASASLHHAHAEDLPAIFSAIRGATRAGGVFHATFKVGSDRRDHFGRFFCAMSEDALRALAADWRNVRIDSGEGPGYDDVITPWLRVRAVR